MDNIKRTSCEIYSRIVGFYSPKAMWNKGKKEEFNERKYYKLSAKEEKDD